LALLEIADLLATPPDPEGGVVVLSETEAEGMMGGEGAGTAPS